MRLLVESRCRTAGGVAITAFMLAACGALGGDGGGAEELPNRGIQPYEYLSDSVGESEESNVDTVVLVAADDALGAAGHPSVVHNQDGAVSMYFERCAEGRCGIWRAKSATPLGTFQQHEAVLTADDAASLGLGDAGVAAPFVEQRQDGTWLWFSHDGRRAIGLVGLADGRAQGGTSSSVISVAHVTELLGLTVEASAIDAPSVVDFRGERRLFLELQADDGSTAIVEVVDPLGAARRARVVLEQGSDCVDALGESEPCWDARRVGSPDVRRARTDAGREYLRMMYRGEGRSAEGIGFAASWDAEDWSRYPFNPVLEEDAPSDPWQLRVRRGYFLYVAVDGAIRVAVNDSGNPTESF